MFLLFICPPQHFQIETPDNENCASCQSVDRSGLVIIDHNDY